MAIDDTPQSIFAPWPDRLRHSALILLAAALALSVVVALGELSLVRACAVFVCIAAAALVPWRLHDAGTSREDVRGVNPVEAAAVSAVVAGMPDPAVLLDRAGRVIHLNAAAAQLAPALRRNELAQFALRSPEIITALREAIATTEPRRATYSDHVPVDRWMELVITPVPVPTQFGGTEKCMLMTFHDLTPLRRVEEMRADFVANASHELRTPLAILRTRIETLDASKGTRELHADIESMSRIVSQLLEIAELDTLVLDPGETADLRAVCAEVVGSIAPYALAQQKDIALRGTDGPVRVKGNAEMLQRAIFNLAENAIKYTADATSVDVEVHEDGSVQVRDCGPGIAPAEQGLVFQRFWRGDRQRHRTDGAGLGLSIVRGVVDDHDATIKVENLPSGGAQFTLSFHLAKAEPATA